MGDTFGEMRTGQSPGVGLRSGVCMIGFGVGLLVVGLGLGLLVWGLNDGLGVGLVDGLGVFGRGVGLGVGGSDGCFVGRRDGGAVNAGDNVAFDTVNAVDFTGDSVDWDSVGVYVPYVG